MRGAGVAVVINQAAADLLWPGANPVGKPIQPGEKIIVAPNVTTRQFGSEKEPHMWQAGPPSRDSRLLIRHAPAQRERLLAALPALARQLDKRFFATAVPYQETVANAVRTAELSAAIAALLGALALLLATVGIYGVAAYSVSQRRREIGVRIALGAKPAGIRNLILGQSARTAAVGAVFGFAGAIGFGRLLRSLLFGLSPTDPLALIGTLATLAASVVLAS